MIKKSLIIVVLLGFTFLSAEGTVDSTSTITKIGQRVPGFSFRTLTGDSLSIEDLKGKVVLLNFFATWCGPCMQEMPHLEKDIWQNYQKQDLAILCIGREHDTEELKEFKAKKNFSMTFIPDPERKIYSQFAEKYIPRNILVDRKGKIVFQEIGFSPEKFQELKRMISEKISN
jgi:peroxiredoxin